MKGIFLNWSMSVMSSGVRPTDSILFLKNPEESYMVRISFLSSSNCIFLRSSAGMVSSSSFLKVIVSPDVSSVII